MKNWAKRSRAPYKGALALGTGRLVLLLLAELEGLFAVEEAESSK
jgi:hypothetical protein